MLLAGSQNNFKSSSCWATKKEQHQIGLTVPHLMRVIYLYHITHLKDP